jgi:NADH-quinone oxidoreductase subunit A
MTPFIGLVGYLVLFTLLGVGFLFVTLLIGKLVRPTLPDKEKHAIYECGEPTIGSSWVQFDLRFYVVALLFVIFDVEVAFFFPWAAVFGKATRIADPTSSPAEVQQSLRELDSSLTLGESSLSATQDAASTLGWIAFGDLVFFFGVVLVGFAYLWKRGDLNWVRATSGETAETRPEMAAAPTPPDSSREPVVV